MSTTFTTTFDAASRGSVGMSRDAITAAFGSRGADVIAP
jgi:hypothetical protein